MSSPLEMGRKVCSSFHGGCTEERILPPPPPSTSHGQGSPADQARASGTSEGWAPLGFVGHRVGA